VIAGRPGARGGLALALGALLAAACAHPAPPPAPAAAPGASAATAAPPVAVKLLTLNDFHGQLPAGKQVSRRPVGSAPALAAHLRAAMAGREDRTVLVEAGDLVGASPAVSALLQDEPTVAFLNGLANAHCPPPAAPGTPPREAVRRPGLLDPRCNVVGVPGNHEFDEGVDELLRLLGGGNHPRGPFLDDPWRGARFPVLAANVRWRDGAPLFPAAVVKELGGVRIGFIGAGLGATPAKVTPAGVAALEFTDEVDAINGQVPALRAQGIRAIVAVVHDGGTGQHPYAGPTRAGASGLSPELAAAVRRLDPEIDVLVTGHTHSFANARLPNAGGREVLVVQAWSAGTAYADVDLALDPASGEVVASSARIVTAWADDPALRPDPAAARLTAAAEERVAPLARRVVGTARRVLSRSPDDAGESPLGDAVAEAHRTALRADFGITNTGGLRADLPAGCGAPPCPITWADCFAAQPFSNELVAVTLTGRELVALLEQQWRPGVDHAQRLQVAGLRYRWSAGAPPGRKVVPGSVRRADGTPLDPDARYTVAVNGFLAGGAEGFSVLGRARERVAGPSDLDALVAWIEAQPQPLAGGTDGRVERVP
jgi:5'-nucleotidase